MLRHAEDDGMIVIMRSEDVSEDRVAVYSTHGKTFIIN